MLWDLNDGKHLYSLEAGDNINALCFSPNRYWLCAATGSGIKIWDLESKSIVDELKPDFGVCVRACTFIRAGSNGKDQPASVHLPGMVCGWTDTVFRVH